MTEQPDQGDLADELLEEFAEVNAEDLTEDNEIAFDFQTVLENIQNLWASDYARALMRDAQVLSQNGTLRRLLAEERAAVKARDAVIEQLLEEKDLSGHAEEAIRSASPQQVDAFLEAR